MFTLPTNATPQVRPEVVNHIVRALFEKKHLDYCDDGVFTDDLGGFSSYWNRTTNRPSIKFTIDERKAAFDEFKSKGYHILKCEWYSSVNGHRLWSYELKETRDCETSRDATWVF